MISGKIPAVLVLSAVGLAAWTVRATRRFDASLDPPVPASAAPRGVSGLRLPWRAVEVPARSAATDATRALGAKLFAANCAECHGPEGKGDGPAARAFSPPPRNFTTGEYRLKSTNSDSLPHPTDLYRTISTGFLATRMPGFSHLSPDERWALVDHVMALSTVVNPNYEEPAPGDKPDPDNWKVKSRFELVPPGEPLAFPPAPPMDDAAIARGRQIFKATGCDKCHGLDGRGDGESSDSIKDSTGALIAPADFTRLATHSKAGADREDVFRVLTTGFQTMPAFGSLTDAQRWDVAAWIHSIAFPGSPEKAAAAREVAKGRELFTRNCRGCHGDVGRGDGPAQTLGFLEVEPRDLTTGVYKWKSTPVGELPATEDIERTLRLGVPGTSMPSWLLVPEPERAELVKYLKAIAPRFSAEGREPRRPVAIPFAPRDLDTKARVALGRELFAKWGCTSCHGATGRGDGALASVLQDIWGYPVRPRDLVHAPLHAGEKPEDVFRVLTVGVEGTPMPPFGAALNETERWALVAFVRELRSTDGGRP